MNERLLRDSCEAFGRATGRGGSPSTDTVAHWAAFIDRPTAQTWYRAHNASIVAAYLGHRDLADGELEDYLQIEHRLGRVLDYAVIQPRLRPLYDWSARELDRPALSGLLVDGGPAYAWPAADRAWEPPRLAVAARALKALTAPR